MTIDPHASINQNLTGSPQNIQFILNEEGKIDWRKMIPPKFLYPNPQQKDRVEKILGKSIKDFNPEVDKLPDNLLCILLPGIMWLSLARGINKVLFSIGSSSLEYASVSCTVSFTPISESTVETYGGCGSASLATTNDFGRNYLLEIASNRAFCRAVRNALGINIVAADELGPDKKIESSSAETTPHVVEGLDLHALSRDKAKSLGFKTYADIVSGLKGVGIDTSSFDKYARIADIPTTNIYAFLTALEKFQNVDK